MDKLKGKLPVPLGGLLAVIIIILPLVAEAQAVTITGEVINKEGSPVSYASVVLEETQQTTVANSDGSFILPGIAPGSYTLKISCVGYQPQSKKVAVPGSGKLSVLIRLSAEIKQLETITVTATRTARLVEEVPMPVDIIPASRIARTGSLRLDEVLLEQTGLQIVSDHGTGLQMQGLSSDYIMIMIDGEPVIGRTAGTMDLTRFAVDNIARIEVIRGPSSSLYGSEAMAGVINIITRKDPAGGFSSSTRTTYRSFGTLDVSANAGFGNEKVSASVYFNRLSTRGYDLEAESVSMTAPPYRAYTLRPKISYRFSDKLKLHLSTGFYTENQDNEVLVDTGNQTAIMKEQGQLKTWNVTPVLDFLINDSHKLRLKNHTTGYRTKSNLNAKDGTAYEHSFFDQVFNRSEIQYDWYVSDRHVTTLGAGHTMEKVEATRYDDINDFQASYGFVQHQWTAGRFNVVAGGRFDMHSHYDSRFSPKVAAGYTVNDWLKVQASFGGGYKAPDFRQLLLNFTNPTAGYTVAGADIVLRRIKELTAQGQIEAIFITPATIEELKAETSIACNAGFALTPNDKVDLSINLFRNKISHLIDTAPVARKTNGQNVFSYFNLDKVITQGITAQAGYQPRENITFSIGYQYLDSRDLSALEKIRAGEVFRRDPESRRTVRVTTSDYGGLINRSQHSGNAKLFYENARHDFNIALRGIYRGKWGFGDVNGNGVVDDDREYADGYFLLNLTVDKRLFGWLTLEAGAGNLLHKTNIYAPYLAGRIWYGGMKINLTELTAQN